MWIIDCLLSLFINWMLFKNIVFFLPGNFPWFDKFWYLLPRLHVLNMMYLSCYFVHTLLLLMVLYQTIKTMTKVLSRKKNVDLCLSFKIQIYLLKCSVRLKALMVFLLSNYTKVPNKLVSQNDRKCCGKFCLIITCRISFKAFL